MTKQFSKMKHKMLRKLVKFKNIFFCKNQITLITIN
jgi:hypothetical protein